jgi:hypothetical protein
MPDQPSKLSQVPLKCIGIILCEAAYQIAGRSNLIIVNTFHALSVPGCPCRFPKITVLYTVTDGHGTYDIELAVVHARTGRDVLTAKDQYTVADPLSIGDVQIVLHGVPLPEPGKYWIELRCNGELVGQRPFYVDVARKPPAPGGAHEKGRG